MLQLPDLDGIASNVPTQGCWPLVASSGRLVKPPNQCIRKSFSSGVHLWHTREAQNDAQTLHCAREFSLDQCRLIQCCPIGRCGGWHHTGSQTGFRVTRTQQTRFASGLTWASRPQMMAPPANTHVEECPDCYHYCRVVASGAGDMATSWGAADQS